MSKKVTFDKNAVIIERDKQMLTEDVLSPYAEIMARKLGPAPPNHRLVTGTKTMSNGDIVFGASWEPIPPDELNLGCDGC